MLVRKDETFNSVNAVNASEVTAAYGFSAAQRGVDVDSDAAVDNRNMPYKGTYTFNVTGAGTETVTVVNPFVVASGTNVTLSGTGLTSPTGLSVQDGQIQFSVTGSGTVTVTVA